MALPSSRFGVVGATLASFLLQRNMKSKERPDQSTNIQPKRIFTAMVILTQRVTNSPDCSWPRTCTSHAPPPCPAPPGAAEPLPDPARQHLAGRILQPLDVVEVVMVELLVEWLERRLQVRKVHDPAQLRIRLAGHVDLDAEGMAMQARALVAGRDVGKTVGGFEGEGFEDVHGGDSTGARVASLAYAHNACWNLGGKKEDVSLCYRH